MEITQEQIDELRSQVNFLLGFGKLPHWEVRTAYRERLDELVTTLAETFNHMFPR